MLVVETYSGGGDGGGGGGVFLQVFNLQPNS